MKTSKRDQHTQRGKPDRRGPRPAALRKTCREQKIMLIVIRESVFFHSKAKTYPTGFAAKALRVKSSLSVWGAAMDRGSILSLVNHYSPTNIKAILWIRIRMIRIRIPELFKLSKRFRSSGLDSERDGFHKII